MASILETARSAGCFATLLTAVEVAGLTAALEGPGPFTVFAPVDGAFEALPPGCVQTLVDNPPQLARILRYHVLGGALSPIDGIGTAELKVEELLARIPAEGVTEVIVATNSTAPGDATASYLASRLVPLGVRVTRLASGLPVGGDLDYADEVTLSRAFAGRREA